MNKEEFYDCFKELVRRSILFSRIAGREGLLALEDFIEKEEGCKRESFKFGLRLVVDGTDACIIDKLLSNIANLEKDKYMSLFNTIQKEAVIAIQQGINTLLLFHLLNSYVETPLSEEILEKSLEEADYKFEFEGDSFDTIFEPEFIDENNKRYVGRSVTNSIRDRLLNKEIIEQQAIFELVRSGINEEIAKNIVNRIILNLRRYGGPT